MRRGGSTILVIVLFILMVIGTTAGAQHRVDKIKYTEMLAEQQLKYEEQIEMMVIEHQDEITRIRAEYEQLTPEKLMVQEAEYIAKVLYGYYNNSERDLRTAVWCILNRVDHAGYPDTVQGVCQQENQWIGYDDNNPVLTEFYDLAMKELETWHNNYRPVSAEYVYMSWSSKEIVLRDTYKTTNATKHWQAG